MDLLTPLFHMHEVPDLNAAYDNPYAFLRFYGFLQSLHANTGVCIITATCVNFPSDISVCFEADSYISLSS